MPEADSLVQELSKLEIVIKLKVSEVKLNGIMQDIGKPVNSKVKPEKKSVGTPLIGTPLKYTDEQRRKVINMDESFKVMAKELGVSPHSLYKYRRLWIVKFPHLVSDTTRILLNKKKHKKYKKYVPKFKEQKNASTGYKVQSAVIDD